MSTFEQLLRAEATRQGFTLTPQGAGYTVSASWMPKLEVYTECTGDHVHVRLGDGAMRRIRRYNPYHARDQTMEELIHVISEIIYSSGGITEQFTEPL